ncbi:Pentatricopeptide repeat-containing protein At5g59600 [Linum grandiflorum]
MELFNLMARNGIEPDVVSWTSVISGLVQNFQNEAAFAHAGMVELGQSLFVLMQRKYNIAPRMEHYACMVDLLGNAGRVKEAYEVIKSIPMEPDLFVWGALLGACRKHGDIELGDIAAQKLAKLEPRNTGNNVLMSSLHAEAGSWSTVARFKKMLNSKKMRFSGCSWIESG